MSATVPYFDAVLRFGEVRISRAELVAALGVSPFRYEPSRKGAGSYAQVNLRRENDWDEIVTLLQQIGPAIRQALDRGETSGVELDVGFFVPGAHPMASLRVPQRVCEALAQHGVELNITVYVTSGEG